MVFKILNVAAITGFSTSSAILLGYIVTSASSPEVNLDWRDIAAIGSIGTILGAHYSITGFSWFNNRYY